MLLLVTAVAGGLLMTMTYEPLHLNGIGSLHTPSAHDQGPKPGVGNLPAGCGNTYWAVS
jgi:hypothetical protein